MTRIFVVYEINGPNGYVPYVYTKSTLDEVLLQSLKEDLKSDIFENIEKVSSKEILDGSKYHDEHIYLIPIDSELEKFDLSEILTPKFKSFVEKRDNFKILYVNHDIPIVRTLV